MRIQKTMLALLFALGGGQAASAASIFVANHSFEDQRLSDGGYQVGFGPADWSGGLASPTGPSNPLSGDFLDAVPDGDNVMFSATGYDGSFYSGSNFQRVADSLMANTRYTLTIEVGRQLGLDLADFAVELTDDASPANSTVYASGTLASDEIDSGRFRTLTFSFDSTTALDKALGIRIRTFYNAQQGTNQRITYFDNVRLDASPIVASAVPEPAQWAFMIGGFGVLGSAARFRRFTAPRAVPKLA